MGGQSSKNSDSSKHNDSTQVSAEGPKRHHRDCDYQFKVLLLGDSAVGKSNLLNRLVDDKFTRIYTGTIGIDFRTYTTTVNGYKVKLQIWDTAGQERFRSINSQYYRGADAALLVFDLTNRNSFDRVEHWVEDIKSHNNKKVAMLVAGNKCDLSEQRVVTDAEGANLAKTINSKFMGTSALQRLNVHESFEELAKETLDLKRNTEPDNYSGDNESHSNVQLDSRSSKKSTGNKSSKCL